MIRINALFVCSRNQWRSPAAERVFRDDARFSVRTRGLIAVDVLETCAQRLSASTDETHVVAKTLMEALYVLNAFRHQRMKHRPERKRTKTA